MVLPLIEEVDNQEQGADMVQEEMEVKDLRPLLLIQVKALNLREVFCPIKRKSNCGKIGLFATSVGSGESIELMTHFCPAPETNSHGCRDEADGSAVQFTVRKKNKAMWDTGGMCSAMTILQMI